MSDRIEDTVDYREVAETCAEVSDGKRFDLLEALAAAVADLRRPLHVERVRVRVRKPKPSASPSTGRGFGRGGAAVAPAVPGTSFAPASGGGREATSTSRRGTLDWK